MNPLTLALRECLSELEDERDPLPQQIITRPAAGAPTPACVGTIPASVFQLAVAPLTITVRSEPLASARRVCVVHRTGDGVTRCTSIPFAETELAKERESKRRARQTPPPPNLACRKSNNKMMDQPVI